MKILATVLLTLILTNAPWRVFVLAAETVLVRPGHTRFTSNVKQYWECRDLETRLEALGWTIYYGFPEGMQNRGYYGLTIPSQHVIYIDESLGWNARYAVLAHEGAHTLAPAWLNHTQEEAFAETVAALVAREGLYEHARYLSNFRSDALLMMVTEWPALYRAAAILEQ